MSHQGPEIESVIAAATQSGRSKESVYLELLALGVSVDALNAAYVRTPRVQEDTGRRTVAIIVTIAALLIAAGIFSFFASNWAAMPAALKIAVILAGMLAAYALAWELEFRRALPLAGRAFLLLGTLIYGAGIFLIAQIYHLAANYPDGFILWMLGALAIAFACASRPHFVLAVITGAIAIFTEQPAIDAFATSSPYVTTSTLLLVSATAVCIAAARRLYQRMGPA